MNTKDGWESRWVKSDWKRDENMAGEWNYTSGKWNGDPNDKGIVNYPYRQKWGIPSHSVKICYWYLFDG